MKKHGDRTNNSETDKISADSKFPKKKKRKKIAIISVTVILLLPLLAFGVAAAGFKIWSDNMEIDASLLPTASSLPVFYDKNGDRIPYSEDKYVSPDAIPKHIKNAFIALEDKRFYSHKGYDPIRIAGAVFNNLKAGKLREGASTITQQLVKNTHLTHERTLKRKLKEIAIAGKIEQRYSKEEILAMYLSVIYFGGGAYGINAASNLYFGKTPDKLTLSESAALAGIVKNPRKYSPKNSISNATERRNVVLDVMRREGYITDSELISAKAEKLSVAESVEKSNAEKFYLDRVIEEVCAQLNITKYQLNNSGYKIYTNLDATLQRAIKSETADKSNYESDKIDSASLIIENSTGAVLAHYSSLPYEVKRQAGSIIKPLAVYAPALDRKLITTATPIVDEPVDFGGWTPQNFGGKYYGATTPRAALMHSMNSVAVKLLSYVGTDSSAEYLSKMGIDLSDGDKNYALALGATANGVKPVEIAGAYAALARGGEFIRPTYVRYVTDGDSKIYSSEIPQANRVFGTDAAYLSTSMLLDTVKSGTAKSLSALPYQIASKTGTAQIKDGSNSDAWNASYTSRHTVLVWHGAESMSEKGGGYPTRHAMKIWKKVYSDSVKPAEFTVPETVFTADVDLYSTKINKKVTLAGKNTPAKYKCTEVFSLSNLPDSSGSVFEKLSEPEWRVSKVGRYVEIRIKSIDAYDYSLYVTDAAGKRKIKLHGAAYGDYDADKNGVITVYDQPVSLGNSVCYELKTSFVSDSGDVMSITSERQIYVDGL